MWVIISMAIFFKFISFAVYDNFTNAINTPCTKICILSTIQTDECYKKHNKGGTPTRTKQGSIPEVRQYLIIQIVVNEWCCGDFLFFLFDCFVSQQRNVAAYNGQLL